MDSMESETELMKQAEHWGRGSIPTLNQTGELKAIFWCTSRCSEFLVENFGVVIGGEVAHVPAPFADGIGDPADQLLDGTFALFGAHHAVEIFGDHDVGGGLRPALGDLDVFLLENHLALFVGDGGGTQFPFDFVEGVGSLFGEHALELEATFAGEGVGSYENFVAGGGAGLVRLCGHASSSCRVSK